jgi:hypothetical protein
LKRIAAILAVLGVMVGGAVVAAPAQQAGAISYNYADITWIRNNMTGAVAGPTRNTGYGKAVLTAFPKATCDGCNWYNVTKSVTNHQPTLALNPAGQRTQASPVSPNSGFCWPWDWGNWFGDGCWNAIDTWNWPFIFSNLNGGYHPWDAHSTIDNIEGCLQGIYQGVTLTVVGKPTIGWLLDNADLLRVSPAGTVYAVIGGCTAYFLH